MRVSQKIATILADVAIDWEQRWYSAFKLQTKQSHSMSVKVIVEGGSRRKMRNEYVNV